METALHCAAIPMPVCVVLDGSRYYRSRTNWHVAAAAGCACHVACVRLITRCSRDGRRGRCAVSKMQLRGVEVVQVAVRFTVPHACAVTRHWQTFDDARRWCEATGSGEIAR
jgi:hypothetical protein